MIKFLDLQKINARFEAEFQDKFKSFMASGHYVLGSEVSSFEAEFAKYCGVKYCVGVSSGLDALILIFKAYLNLGILKKDDEIIVPANTFIASIIAIVEVGLKPILVEPDLETYNISAAQIENKITSRTKAILIVHLYGKLANMKPINLLAQKHDLLLIEDAAQAHGAEDKNGFKAGSYGDAAAFSFYPSKNLGALGDAGAIVTNSIDLSNMINKLRNYGGTKKYIYDILGGNHRLDEIQAIFLNIKLKHLETDNKKRREIAIRYLEGIKNDKIKLPAYNGSKNHVFYAFVVLANNRQAFIDHLTSCGVETLVHYPVPPHKQKPFTYLDSNTLPVTETIHNSIVSLPISPVMEYNEIQQVIEAVNTF